MSVRQIAIDFETANAKRVSACSVGVAVIEDGQVVETYSSLIKPPAEFGTFAPLNVRIHGITAEKVANAPTFDALYPRLREIADGADILGYSKFDRSVLQNLSGHYGLPVDRSRIAGYIDVCSIAQKELPQLKNHKLRTLAKYFNIGSFHHHDASDDAIVCALVFLSILGADLSGKGDVGSICRKALEPASSHDEVPSMGNAGEFSAAVLDAATPYPPSQVETAKAFNAFASMILEDNVIDYKEAIELNCFLSVLPKTKGVERLKGVLDDFLEDNAIDHGESCVLAELILDVSAELTGLPVINCHSCGAPVRSELSDVIAACPWCGAPFIA
ncbi:MAG: 3'-5' exonuclease [Kiritimatiellae bacterium]|nr:3'-5' exonuclease [Kiritimatiellia bacterium]